MLSDVPTPETPAERPYAPRRLRMFRRAPLTDWLMIWTLLVGAQPKGALHGA